MPKLTNILVYEWHAWKGFLISHLIADYCRVAASYQDQLGDIEQVLNPNIKAVLLQINLSRSNYFPEKRAELITGLEQKGLMVFNRNITDITKNNLHRLLADAGLPCAKAIKDGDADEFLFIKSNLNAGGLPEQRLPESLRDKFDVMGPSIAADQYYIAQRKKIKPAVWHNKAITIEKYIANNDNSFYRVYGFGDALVIVKAYTNALIKKISGNEQDVNYYYCKDEISNTQTDLPKALNQILKQFIERIPLDYFCLDIVHNSCDYYIVDINLTPWSGVQDQSREASEFLCLGAKLYLKRRLA